MPWRLPCLVPRAARPHFKIEICPVNLPGFAGLIYESVWSHYLKLFLGHAAYAQSLVLIIFMGGLALGSWIASRYATRWQRPILIYAVVEGIIGLLALGFHSAFVGVTDAFYDTIFPAVDSPLMASVLKWSAAALLMMPQSILLGMTFPLLTGGVIRRYPEQPGNSLATLYFTNSLGAAAGVLAAGFVLIGWGGLPGTIELAGYINLGLAVLVVTLLQLDREPGTVAAAAAPDAKARRSGQLFLLAALVTGAASFIYEVGWIRMLSLVLGGSTHAFELMLSAFITGLAFGGLFVRRYIDRVADPLRFAAWVQIGMAVLAALSLPIYGQSFDWVAALLGAVSRSDQGFVAFTVASHAVALAVMLPATFLAGMTLPLFTHVMMREGHGEMAIGRIYAANTFGAILGVLFAMHIGLPLLGVKNTIGVGALLDLALGLSLLWLVSAPARRLPQLTAVAALGAILVLGSVLTTSLKPDMLASGVYRYGRAAIDPTSTVPFYKDGKTASIAVVTHPAGFTSIRTNGKPDASIETNPQQPASADEITMVMAGALPLAYKADVRHVANIGFGSGLTTHTLLALPDVEVDTVEIEPAMIAGARLFLPRVARAYEDPRSRIHLEDAKAFFPLRGQRYDLIVAEPSNPWVSGVASLFSEDFYRLSSRYLADDGLFVQWLQFYEFNDDLYLSILKAVAANFGDFVIYSNQDDDGLIVARHRGQLDPPDFEGLLSGPLRQDLARVGMRVPADFHLRRVADRAMLERLLALPGIPANSDYYPWVDLGAGKARFREQRARLFTEWSLAPLPIVEMLSKGEPGLDGRFNWDTGLTRARRVLEARVILDKLLDRGSGGAATSLDSGLQLAMQYSRSATTGCDMAPDPAAWLAAIHPLMERTLPFLTTADGEALLQAVLPANCNADLPANVRAWLALYGAAAQRDPAGMYEGATALLADSRYRDALDGRRQSWLFGAMLLGAVASGDPARADNAWAQLRGDSLYLGYKPPLYLDGLLALTGRLPGERTSLVSE
jgi:spermidine synthase